MPEQGRRGLLAEVQHRRVFRVAALYVVTAWVVLQVGDVIVEPLDLPEWTQRLVVTLAMLGFPIVIVLAWLFDVTPEGVVTGGAEDARPTTGRGLDIALVVIAIALVGFSVVREPTVAPVITERPPETQGAPAHSIAVLPFDNLSPLEANAFFAAGIHEDILAHLAQIEALTVISRQSVLRYDETDLALTEIAAELGVANILEGTVRRAGDRVRITVQLIEAATDTHLWAESYDRDLTDVFAIQTEVAKRIAAAMEIELTGSTAERLALEPTQNLEAYDLYLTARTLPVTIDGFNAKVELNREAVALDPSFGLAWASIAEVTGGLMGLTGHTQALAEQGYAPPRGLWSLRRNMPIRTWRWRLCSAILSSVVTRKPSNTCAAPSRSTQTTLWHAAGIGKYYSARDDSLRPSSRRVFERYSIPTTLLHTSASPRGYR